MYLFICILSTLCFLKIGQTQYYGVSGQFNQNSSMIPYPYQNIQPAQPAKNSVSNQQLQGYPSYPGFTGYPFWLGQMGLPRYQNPIGYQGYGAYPPMYGMPFNGNGYPPIGSGIGNPPINSEIMGYPSATADIGFAQQAHISEQPGVPQQDIQGINNVEIIDVSPELQRKMLGWPAESGGLNGEKHSAGGGSNKPRYTVDIDTQTSNQTVIPHNLSKPFVNEKKYLTTIRRSFVYDSKNPEPVKPINIHIINGQQITTTPPPETTVNENVEGITAWYN